MSRVQDGDMLDPRLQQSIKELLAGDPEKQCPGYMYRNSGIA